MDVHTPSHDGRQLRAFFLLVGLLSVPFWLAGAFSDATITSQLSVASLMIVAPFLSAVLLTWRSSGRLGLRGLLGRAVDPRLRGGSAWYLPVVAFMPAAVLVEVVLLQAFGQTIPAFEVTPAVLLVDLVLFWVAATLEEVGWTGYATDRLRERHTALATALILGFVWALWHIPAMLAMPSEPPWSFIVLQCGVLVAMRVIMVWVYDGSGRSVFAVIALHAVSNISTMTLYPVYGSHYDPLAALVVLSIAASVVTGISAVHRRRLGRGRVTACAHSS